MIHAVEALRRRDAVAWEEFYREHLREVYGFLFRLVRNDRPAAEDLFQETWLEALDAIGQFDPRRGELRGWLFGIARRRVALYWRRKLATNEVVRHVEPLTLNDKGAILPENIIEQVEQAAVVQAALLALPPERRLVLTEKYVNGCSVDQIAVSTGKSPKAVESLLTRARNQLRTLLSCYFSNPIGGKRT
jgi:RNA polymerase sigma-70 factor (ECF subfamily)